MNAQEMANFIESLDEEQMNNFKKLFNAVGEQMEEVVTEDKEQIEKPASRKVKEDFTVETNVKNKREPVKAGKNLWVDDGSVKLEDGEKEFDTSKGRSERERPPTKKIKLTCSVCKREFEEHPSLVFGEYHRCNRCVRS